MRARLRTPLILALACVAGLASAGPAEDTAAAEAAIRSGDVFTAMGTLRRLADGGYGPAQARLADLLHAAENDAEAVLLYRKAADQGDPAGQCGLAKMHADGTGVPRDDAEALRLYRLAAQKNYAPAFDALARAYRTGTLGLAKDVAEAAAMDARARELRGPDPQAPASPVGTGAPKKGG